MIGNLKQRISEMPNEDCKMPKMSIFNPCWQRGLTEENDNKSIVHSDRDAQLAWNIDLEMVSFGLFLNCS